MPLMTYEEYLELYPTWPHIFKIQSGEQWLYYFGEAHSYDPTHPQWVEFRALWIEFLEVTKDKKRMVFVEGGLRNLSKDLSADDAIKDSGGMGLSEHLAHKEGIEVQSPEPPEDAERTILEKQFTRDQIQYYYFARVVDQWHRTAEPRLPFAEYMQPYLDADKRRSGWPEYDFSLEHMKKIHTDLFSTPFDESDVEMFSKLSDPIRRVTVVNNVAGASSEYRDTYIVDQIVQKMKEGYSLFVHYGGSHGVMQEPLLRELLS